MRKSDMEKGYIGVFGESKTENRPLSLSLYHQKKDFISVPYEPKNVE